MGLSTNSVYSLNYVLTSFIHKCESNATMYRQESVFNYCPDPPRGRELPLPMNQKWSETFEA